MKDVERVSQNTVYPSYCEIPLPLLRNWDKNISPPDSKSIGVVVFGNYSRGDDGNIDGVAGFASRRCYIGVIKMVVLRMRLPMQEIESFYFHKEVI